MKMMLSLFILMVMILIHQVGPPISDISVKLIGVAVEEVKRGVICASFNAG
jgi:hypothetical protein